jgi:hypothetical protein
MSIIERWRAVAIRRWVGGGHAADDAGRRFPSARRLVGKGFVVSRMTPNGAPSAKDSFAGETHGNRRVNALRRFGGKADFG